MDNIIHARFWRVSETAPGAADFHEILLEEAKKATVGDREHDLGEGVTARLERCTHSGDYLSGELCRVHTGNFPPEASTDGLIAMQLKHGIGHVAAFRYHLPTRVLLLQRNAQSISTNRLSLYLAASKPGLFFTFTPVMAADALERFKKKRPRSFSVTFAGPHNLVALDDEDLPAAKGARMIAEAYDGIRVTIDVSVGKSKKLSLNKDELLEAIGRYAGFAGVKKLKVVADENGDNDVINFLKEQTHFEETLANPDIEPAKNYEARNLLLQKAFVDNLEALKAQFG